MSSNGYNDSILAKSMAACVMGIISIAIAVAPRFCLPWLRNRNLTSFIAILEFIHTCGWGVLLSKIFLHLMPEVFEAFIEFKEGIFTKNPIYDAMVFIFFGFFSLCAAVLGPQIYIDYLNRSNARPSIGQELQPVNQPLNNPSNPISEPPPVNTADPCCSYHHAPAVTVCEDDDIIEPFPLPDSNPCPFLDSHPRPLPGSDLNQYSKIIAAINGYVLVLSLTFYEFFEGITLQLPASLERAWYKFGAMTTYKFVIAYFVGCELREIKCEKCLANIYIFYYSLMYPLGIFLGMAFTTVDQIYGKSTAVFQAIATGTLLYGLFFQILRKVKHETKKWIAVFLAFIVMVLIQAFVNHQYSHS